MANINPLGSETKLASEQQICRPLDSECEKILNACVKTVALCQSRLESWLARQSTFTAETPLNILLAAYAESLPVKNRSQLRIKSKNITNSKHSKNKVLDPLNSMITFRIYALRYIMAQLPQDIDAAYVQIRYWMAREHDIHHGSAFSERHFIHEMEENLRSFISPILKKMLIGQNSYLTLRAPLPEATDSALRLGYNLDDIQRDLCLSSRSSLEAYQDGFDALIAGQSIPQSPLGKFFLDIAKKTGALSVKDNELQEKFTALFSPLIDEMSRDLSCPEYIDLVKKICVAYNKSQCTLREFNEKLSLCSQLLSQYKTYKLFLAEQQTFIESLNEKILKFQEGKSEISLANGFVSEQLTVVAKMDQQIARCIAECTTLKSILSDCEEKIRKLFNTALDMHDANKDILDYVLSCSKKLLALQTTKINLKQLVLDQDLLEFLGNPEDAGFLLASQKLLLALNKRTIYINLCKAKKEPKDYSDEQPVAKQPKRVIPKPQPMTIELWRAHVAKLASLARQDEIQVERKLTEEQPMHQYSVEQLKAAFGHLSAADMKERQASIAALKITPTIKELFDALYDSNKEQPFGHQELMRLISSLQQAGLNISYEMRGSHYKIIFHNAVFAESAEPGRETAHAFRPHGSQANNMPNNGSFTSQILENLRTFFNRCGFEITVGAGNKLRK